VDVHLYVACEQTLINYYSSVIYNKQTNKCAAQLYLQKLSNAAVNSLYRFLCIGYISFLQAVIFHWENKHDKHWNYEIYKDYIIHKNIAESIFLFQLIVLCLALSVFLQAVNFLLEKCAWQNVEWGNICSRGSVRPDDAYFCNYCQHIKVVLWNNLISWAQNFMVWRHWTCSWTLEFVDFK